MWLSKFLDTTDDIKSLTAEIKSKILEFKLTPLQFTILENLFNNKTISGYDLIKSLNVHFAGTWKARSGTIYPILSKLQRKGFLESRSVRSPLGPLRKVYNLTEAGEKILKFKVNKNFLDQLKFVENVLIELSSIYIHSFPEDKQEKELISLQTLLEESFKNIRAGIPLKIRGKVVCPECHVELDRTNAAFCFICGASLTPTSEDDEEKNELSSVEEINGKDTALDN